MGPWQQASTRTRSNQQQEESIASIVVVRWYCAGLRVPCRLCVDRFEGTSPKRKKQGGLPKSLSIYIYMYIYIYIERERGMHYRRSVPSRTSQVLSPRLSLFSRLHRRITDLLNPNTLGKTVPGNADAGSVVTVCEGRHDYKETPMSLC